MIAPFWKRLRVGRATGNTLDIPPEDRLHVPSGVVVYAIGDVHGQISQLNKAVDWIVGQAREAKPHRAQAVLLGDYVDRGEDSRAVLERLSTLARDEPGVEWTFLLGNHEAVMLAFLDTPTEHGDWLHFGGRETLLSYGVRPPLDPSARSLRTARDQLAAVLPPSHLRFLKGLPPMARIGDYCFVHAGLRPDVPLTRQKAEDMLWIREEFLDNPQWYGACVVHGHTIEPAAAVHPWRIGLDTGAFSGGPLTCLALTANQRKIIGF